MKFYLGVTDTEWYNYLRTINPEDINFWQPGGSMEPRISDGAYCIFRPVSAGTKDGKIILVQHHSIDDPDTGGSYTIRKYTRSIEMDKSGEEVKTIILETLNREYEPIVLAPGDSDVEEQIQVIGEFVGVI